MAVGSHGTKSDSGADYAASGAQFVEYEEFIEAQLRKTRSHVRGVDIATATMVLLASTLGYFFVAVLVDHWLVSGGLGFWGRTILLALYLVAAGWWTISQIMPLLLRRINPLYAAQTIEHSRPTLKNALVNFLLFRSDPQAVHQRVFEQIEQQAATSLVGVEVESTVDRSQLVKIGYVLVALVAVGAIYALVSPKNPFKTVSRVFMPWADIAPPTSTVIDEIEPGSTQAFRGQQVTVKARVQGLPDGEQVLLYYTTADRQIVDRAVEMARPSGDYRHAAVLPAGDAALQQSIAYRIEAGDAKSRDYQIEVVAAPTIVVQSVEYKYPAYTGLLAQRVEHQGDLKAIEGTEVTLEGVANQPIGKAYVDFEANGSLDLTMRPEGTTARTSFRLGMSEDRKKPEYELYQLIFKNPDGQQNPQPVRHRIEVIADLAPEIQFVDPTREEIEIPLDGSAGLELVASDPDFALADVRLVMQHGGKPLVDEKLLKEPWRGQFVKKQRFSPKAHQLAAGEVVEYYAVAVDNKLPVPNRKETSRRRIRISSPTGRGEEDQLAQNDAGGEQESGDRSQSQSGGDGERPRDEQPEAAEQESQATGQGANSSPEDAAARNEPDQQPPADDQPGEQNAEQEKQSQDAGNESSDQAGSKDSAGDRQGPSEDQSEPQPSGEEQPAGENSDSGESSDGGSEQGTQSGGKQSGSKQSGEQQEGGQSGEQPSGSEQDSSEQDSSEQGGSGEQQSEGSAGQKQGKQGQNQSGGKQSGKGQSGQQQESENVASDGTNDGDAIERILKHRDQQDPNAGNQSGEKSTGKDQQNAKQSSGDKQAAGKQAGNQQSGNQSGQKPTGSKQQGQQESGQQRGSGQEQGSKSDANHSAQEQADPAQQQNGKQPGGQQQKDKSGDAKSTSGNEEDKAEQGQPSDTNQQASDQQGASDAGERAGDKSGSKPGAKQQPERTPGEGQQSTENSSGDKSGGEQQEPTSREGNQGDQGATRDNNTREDGSPQKTDTQGQGGQSKDDPMRSPDQKPQQSSQQRPDAKGGDGQQEKGESGAGKKSEDNAGSPSPQESNQPREKSQQPGSENAEEKPEGDEQSPSTSKRESDSSGESDGDRSGGGEKGGGQKANQSGTGGAGQNTAADEGAGQSDEAGDGETSDRAGGDRESKDQTGQQGKQPGQGSQTKNGGGQEQAGGDQAPSQPGGEPANDQNSGGEGSGTPGGDQGGANTPKGAGNSAPDKQWQPGVDHADDANLDYTRQATDLALGHLKDQLADGRDDSELLKQLGWTREEADAFVQRWETMRGQAQTSGPKGDAARRELDETLRSLGLRPRGSAIRAGGKADDRAAGLQESRRTTPPPEYSEAFKAYTQGTSRGGK